MAEMVDFLCTFYKGLSVETAAELVLELKDKRSLARLVGFCGDARAVPVSTPPTIFTGDMAR